MLNLSFQRREGYVQVGELNGVKVYGPPPTSSSSEVSGVSSDGVITGAPQPSARRDTSAPAGLQLSTPFSGAAFTSLPASVGPSTPIEQTFPSGIGLFDPAFGLTPTPGNLPPAQSPGGTFIFDTPPSYQIPNYIKWRLASDSPTVVRQAAAPLGSTPAARAQSTISQMSAG